MVVSFLHQKKTWNTLDALNIHRIIRHTRQIDKRKMTSGNPQLNNL